MRTVKLVPSGALLTWFTVVVSNVMVVFGVKPGSAAHAIGMKNGDQITAIDGDPIKNAQQLLDLYAKLDNLTGVELQGQRAGKPLAIALRLR